jgi:hypothetical protein
MNDRTGVVTNVLNKPSLEKTHLALICYTLVANAVPSSSSSPWDLEEILTRFRRSYKISLEKGKGYICRVCS